MSKLLIAAFALAVALLGALPAQAQSLLTPSPFAEVVDEVRVGLHAHDVSYILFAKPWEYKLNQIEDVSFEVLFKSPDIEAFRWIGSPRPELGATLNLDGVRSFTWGERERKTLTRSA